MMRSNHSPWRASLMLRLLATLLVGVGFCVGGPTLGWSNQEAENPFVEANAQAPAEKQAPADTNPAPAAEPDNAAPVAPAAQAPRAAQAAPAAQAKRGYVLSVPLPITVEAGNQLIDRLKSLAKKPLVVGERQIVLLEFGTPDSSQDGTGTEFEEALRLARVISGPELRNLRIVAFVTKPVRGHAVLPILACDQLLVTPQASVGDASADDVDPDPSIQLLYESIAARRGLFPQSLVDAMLNPGLELVQVTELDGTRRLVSGEELDKIRAAGESLQESQLSTPGATAILDGNALRQARMASHQVQSLEEAADALRIAAWERPEATTRVKVENGTLVELNGNVTTNRIRRIEANLASPANHRDTDAWIVVIDSPGGSLEDSMRLASTFSVVAQDQRLAAGWVQTEALGDSILIAASCRPFLVASDARLGGPGAQNLTPQDVRQMQEAIDQIAMDANRPATVLAGLLDPELKVFHYTDGKTGRKRIATPEQIAREEEQDQSERWSQGDPIDLSQGISGAQAVELGLADGIAENLEAVTAEIGLKNEPRRLSDRKIVRAVEWLGNRPFLPVLLLMIGFMTFSMELSAPGLGVPGFISMLCFSLFFWMSFLAGTAEWLELVAFGLGVIFILIEIFVVPGVGVFGLGGLAMLISGVVLASQTFVIPRNPYQYARMSETLWMVIASCVSLVAGVILLRLLLPNTKLFGHLHLAAPDGDLVEQREQLVHFEHLVGTTGTTVTALRPAGKARIGDNVYAVVSDGSAINEGEPITVLEVHGNRIVVIGEE
ncbi:NfeD family protein [Roseimaritima multifibrata]|nr:NfeD family protein [Roseimaritima multifibrata]